MKLIVYGTMNCHDTVEALDAYKAAGYKVLFRDIDSSTKVMKEFLKLRDTEDVFKDVRANHTIGVPCIVKEDRTLTLDWKSLLPPQA